MMECCLKQGQGEKGGSKIKTTGKEEDKTFTWMCLIITCYGKTYETLERKEG